MPKLPLPALPLGKILAAALQTAAIAGGVAGGVWLKTSFSDGAAAHSPSAEKKAKPEKAGAKDEHAAEKKKGKSDKKAEKKDAHGKKDAHAKKGGHGGDDYGAEGDDTSFMKFSRQFVIPIIERSGVKSLVVMDINIETPPGVAETIYTREPKLRDALLAALLRLSNDGAFDERLLEADNLDTIRLELLGAARSVVGQDAQNVLILNMTRQDV